MKNGEPRPGSTPLEKINGPVPPLRVADIVMIRHRKNFFRFFLRKVMGGNYWDHTALVIYPKDEKEEIEHDIIVESIRYKPLFLSPMRGVAMHRLDRYLNDPDLYDVGIRRVSGLSNEQLDRVRMFMLMNVDAPYWPWQKFKIVLAAFSKRWAKRILERQRFSCSGLIQKAFYDAMEWNEKGRVVFKRGIWSPLELQELVTPADIAESSQAEWVYNRR
jgi:hypothetical protein